MIRNTAYIVACVRTAGGKRGGGLSGWHPAQMGAQILNDLGCVGQAGEQANNVARNAVLASILPESVPATSVDRQCGSSQQAVHFAAQAVMSGTQDVVIASGVESMSRVPMGMPSTLPRKNGFGFSMSAEISAKYGADFSQFVGAEMVAANHNITREQMDAFSLTSHEKASAATNAGLFKDEILPLQSISYDPKTGVTQINEGKMHSIDEGIRFDASLVGLAKVKPLQEGGLVTAANASQMCDGASGMMIVNERGLKMLGIKPLAKIHHMSVHGGDPVIMLDAPLAATMKALKMCNLTINDIDLFEINEAFASVPLAWLKHTQADPAKLNINGGAIALGHPLGSSGTKLMTSLVYALKQQNKKYGLQSMCEGGGMANVTIIENIM